MKVLHVITDLDTGGAEMMLYKLLFSLRDDSVESSVITLMKGGEVTKRIEELGVNVSSLDLSQGKWPSWKTIKKLKIITKASNPDIIQGWMYHGNIVATFAFLYCFMHEKAKLFWNVRQTLYDLNNEKFQTRWLIILGRWLSFLPQGIIYNSIISEEQHVAVGFLSKKTNIIPNGFDLKKFRPDQNIYKQFRKDLRVSENTILIGHISRLHPMKDHATLLRAIDRVTENISDSNGKKNILFLLVGHGVTSELSDNASIHFLGEQSDIPKIMSALDILVLSSAWGEGFPNVIGEAMASEVPCVVTDVGDSAYIVGKYGKVCLAGDDQCIADSILHLINNKKERRSIGVKGRKRIKESYSMNEIKGEYLKVWEI